MKMSVRNRYLGAMGVSQWIPRHPLPNAANSHKYFTVEVIDRAEVEQPQKTSFNSLDVFSSSQHTVDLQSGSSGNRALVENTSAGNQIAGTITASTSLSDSISSDFKENSANARTHHVLEGSASSDGDATDKESIDPPATVQRSNIIPRFKLFFHSFTSDIVWITDEYIESPLFYAFLQRVKHSLGLDTSFTTNPGSFVWPFIESATQDQSEAVALQALRAQWAFMQDQGVKHVVVWGSDSVQWLNHITDSTIFSYKERELQLNAAIKADLWRALRTVTVPSLTD